MTILKAQGLINSLFVYLVLHQLSEATTTCNLKIAESIPENLTFPSGSPSHESTFDGWMEILQLSKSYVNISSFYMTLNGSDTNTKDPSSNEGDKILATLESLGKNGVSIRIVQEISRESKSDAQMLEKLGLAHVQYLNMNNFGDEGILHTKLILVDGMHMYLGSANTDWRSLTQVKELGLLAINCPELVRDAAKLFDVYWLMSVPGAQIPREWPTALGTSFNMENPMKLDIGSSDNPLIFLSSSPGVFCPAGRTRDLAALIDVIRTAEKYVHVAVMDYLPAIIYSARYRFWPVIDDELRRAAIERGVEVQVLASNWTDTREDMLQYLCSLAADDKLKLNWKSVGGPIQVKLFNVPSFTPAQKKIPYARVNHNKYMVTDDKGYIGTSNWTGDYFNGTAGVSATIQQEGDDSLPQQLRDIFTRDWNSKYAAFIKC